MLNFDESAVLEPNFQNEYLIYLRSMIITTATLILYCTSFNIIF
jgi:hypothetical protein